MDKKKGYNLKNTLLLSRICLNILLVSTLSIQRLKDLVIFYQIGDRNETSIYSPREGALYGVYFTLSL